MMKCDMCSVKDKSVGFSGCDCEEHSNIKICKDCDVDGSNYNGWDDECLECLDESEEEED